MHSSGERLHIDIPVKLTEVNAVLADWSAKSEIIAVFHPNAGHVTLNDGAYNPHRNITTGNPYKGLIADLIKSGVQIELCGATARNTGG